MEPVTIGLIAVAAASGLAQLWNSERQRGANASRLKQIEKMFNEIVPPEYNISVWDDPELVKTVPPAAFDTSRITPESFASVGQYVPEVAQFVQETRPELVQASAAAMEGRAAQMDALRRYKDIAAGQADPLFQQKMQEASDRARIEAQGRMGAVLQDAQRRGALDSGVQLAAQMQGNTDAMTRGALASQAAAAEAYRNQLMALDKSAALGGDVRSSEMSEAARNAGIINDFNQRTSRNYQDYLNQRANTANQASRYNLERNQAIADANVTQRNKFTVDNLNRYNNLAAQTWQMANKQRDDKIAIEQYKNTLRQKNFENQMNQAAAKSGLGSNIIKYENQAAADRNTAIQGLGETAMGGLMLGSGNKTQEQDNRPDYSGANQSYMSRPMDNYDFEDYLRRRGN